MTLAVRHARPAAGRTAFAAVGSGPVLLVDPGGAPLAEIARRRA